MSLAGASLVLGLGGCDLAALADKLADDFERGIQERAAEAVRNAQAKIGQSGGDVTTHDGAVAVPAGAVEGEVQVAVAQVDPAMLSAPLSSALDPVTPPVAFTPHGTTFSEAVTLSLFFEKSVGTSNLHVVRLDSEQDTSWERVDPETVQFDSGLALVSTTHFSVYGVVACDSGKFADLCRAFESGEATIADLINEAPPADDAWGDVYHPPSSDDGSNPDTMTDQCRDWLEQCRPVFDTCSKDPRADVCSRIEECVSYAEQCGATLPPIGGGDDPCAPLADACKNGDRVACDAYTQCIDGTAEDPCAPLADACDRGDELACQRYEECVGSMQPPDDECLVLQHDCAYGNKDACTRFDSLCGEPPPPPPEDCQKLNDACKAGDEAACAQAADLCGPVQLDCASLDRSCQAGDQNACNAYQLNCGGEPPPDDCEQLSSKCDAGDQLSCDLFMEQCAQPSMPSQAECDDAFLACNDGISDACDFWKTECEAYYPPPPPPDGGPAGCGEIVWATCKTVDNCGSAVTCEGDPPPVPTNVQPVGGDFVHCDYTPACTADGMCSDNWTCVVNP